MVNINAADHGRFVKEWHVTDSPRFTSNLGTNLDQNLAADAPDILASGDCIGENYLAWYRQVLQ